jgi:hypothetical protein
MSIGLAFWIIILVGLCIGLYFSWPNRQLSGGLVVVFVLLCLLGWHVFGPPIHG